MGLSSLEKLSDMYLGEFQREMEFIFIAFGVCKTFIQKFL